MRLNRDSEKISKKMRWHELNDIKISENFNLKEFECKSTGQVKIHEKLLELLQELRDTLDKPVIINSGYRSKEHNEKVGGAKKSQHLQGTAVDISLRNLDYSAKDLAIFVKNSAEYTGVGAQNLGLGYADNFLHVDVRGLISQETAPVEWNY